MNDANTISPNTLNSLAARGFNIPGQNANPPMAGPVPNLPADNPLAKFDHVWNKSKTDANNITSKDVKVPDGDYVVKVDKAVVRTSKAGNPMMIWTLEVLAGDFAGGQLAKFSMLTTAENLTYLAKDLAVCELDLERVSDLQSRLGELLDIVLRIHVKNNGDYTNIYFNERLKDEAPVGDVLPGQDLLL